MSRKTYNYRFDVLRNAMLAGSVREPFNKCTATYSTLGQIDSAEIDGFGPASVGASEQTEEHGRTITVVGNGSVNLEDMMEGTFDGALTIRLTFSGVHSYNPPRTVLVELTDEDGETFPWTTAVLDQDY